MEKIKKALAKFKKLPCERCGRKNTDSLTSIVTVQIKGESSPPYRLCDECRTFVLDKFSELDRARLQAQLADIDLLARGGKK